jgi:type VI secretion system protein VasG
MIDSILTNTMLPAISQQFLQKMIDGQPIADVNINVADGQFTYDFG